MKFKYFINDLKLYALEKGGECLSSKYIGESFKYKWRCYCGCEWNASWGNIYYRGSWCPDCGFKKIGESNKYSLNDCIRTAKENFGFCLSEAYVDCKTSMVWKCSCGYEWSTNYDCILNGGTWCPRCAGVVKLTIVDAREAAKKRNGLCLSDIVENCNSKLMWKCVRGHIWTSSLDNVRQGHWCPYCLSSIGEKITREFFDRIFGVKFKKCSPSWLITDTGRRLVFDGYNDELKIAFEYDGIQHREDVKFFRLQRSFADQIYCDNEKKRLCVENNVKLFLINDNVKYSDIASVIYSQSKCFGIKLNENLFGIDYKKFNIYDDLCDVRNLIKSNGGKLISDKYIGCREKLEIMCDCGHKFFSSSTYIKSGNWCPVCAIDKRAASNRLYTINDLKEFAGIKKGFCFSEKYINCDDDKYLWGCSCGFKWCASWNNIKRGKWCPKCGYKKLWRVRYEKYGVKGRK